MKGTVVHFRGKFRRSIERKGIKPRVKVEITLPETLTNEESAGDEATRRPPHYAFFVNGELFAYSRKVTFAQGRRYSQIEHWFVCADDPR